MSEFQTTRNLGVPRQAVWDLISVQTNWAMWTPARSVHLDPPGSAEPDGVGAVRVMKAGPVRTREEIVAYDAPERMVYRLHGSFPVKNYEATVHLSDDGDGTLLRFSAHWDPPIKLLGTVVDRFMKRTIERMAAGIEREAQRRTGTHD